MAVGVRAKPGGAKADPRQAAGERTSSLAEACPFDLDLSQPVIFQVGHLGERYWSWVHQPVGGAPRFFSSNVLEHLTRTPWWVVPLIWAPIVAVLVLQGWQQRPGASGVGFLGLVACGLLLWQLIEYCIHRLLFHKAPKGYWAIAFHFGLHGCHHKFPNDRQRLVFPPAPAGVISIALFSAIRMLLPQGPALAIFAGVVAGYLAYDCVHYALHHGYTRHSVLGRLRAHHLAHHYREPSAGFGISSSLFDRLLGT